MAASPSLRLNSRVEYVFLSYSRKDEAYVSSLVQCLQDRGIDVWLDEDRIRPGARFRRSISDAIDGCSAFIVLMSPAANESNWVEDELDWAMRRRKPLFSLLRDGEVFFGLSATQYDDVSDGSLPSDDFLNALREHVGDPSLGQGVVQHGADARSTEQEVLDERAKQPDVNMRRTGGDRARGPEAVPVGDGDESTFRSEASQAHASDLRSLFSKPSFGFYTPDTGKRAKLDKLGLSLGLDDVNEILAYCDLTPFGSMTKFFAFTTSTFHYQDPSNTPPSFDVKYEDLPQLTISRDGTKMSIAGENTTVLRSSWRNTDYLESAKNYLEELRQLLLLHARHGKR